MRLPTLLRKRGTPTQIGGVARLDRRTKNLTKRLRAGEIAIIHHSDLDRVSAEALVEAGVAAVVNAVSSVSGRYPNLGPGILLDAGITLIDDAGESVFTAVHEGDRLTLDGDRLLDETGAVLVTGTLVSVGVLEEKLEQARLGLSDQIEAFADNVPQTIAWLQSIGVRFDFLPTQFLTKSQPRLLPVGGGAALVEALAAKAEALEAKGVRVGRTPTEVAEIAAEIAGSLAR